MKKILTTLTLAVSGLIFAQVGINAGELSEGAPVQIATDAVFHVENASTSVHKGVLLPKVTLNSETDQTTTSGGTVTTGLMVWNTGTSGLTPAGYYYWNGAKWVLTGNVDGSSSSSSSSTIANITEFKNSSYTLTSDDTVVVCKEGATLHITIPNTQFVKGRNFVVLNNNCSGGLIMVDENGNNVLTGNSVNTGVQEGIGQHLYYDGNKWFNTTGY